MSDSDRDMRRVAKRLNITFKSLSAGDQWPEARRAIFGHIQTFGDVKFATDSPNIDIASNEEPWKQEVKRCARRLCSRANQLANQQRNEAGRRFGIENGILQRFTIEVAW